MLEYRLHFHFNRESRKLWRMIAKEQNNGILRTVAGAGLTLETALALGLAWILVFVLPLRWAKALFGPPQAVAGAPPSDFAHRRAAGVAGRIGRLSPLLPWRCSCLVQAIGGSLLLARRGIGGTVIRFGVRKNDGKLEAHAWLLLGETILLGGAGAADFTPLADFRYDRSVQ